MPQIILAGDIAAFRRLSVGAGRLLVIDSSAPAILVDLANITRCLDIAPGGGFFKPGAGSAIVNRCAVAFQVDDPHVGHCVRIAAFDRFLHERVGLGFVRQTVTAVDVGIPQAQQRFRVVVRCGRLQLCQAFFLVFVASDLLLLSSDIDAGSVYQRDR